MHGRVDGSTWKRWRGDGLRGDLRELKFVSTVCLFNQYCRFRRVICFMFYCALRELRCATYEYEDAKCSRAAGCRINQFRFTRGTS